MTGASAYFLDKTRFVVPTLTACFQLYTRSAGVAYFIVGALSCSLSVKVLKMVLKRPRPVGRLQKVTYGMPSTHAATISYYASYICAACISLPPHGSLQNNLFRFTPLVPVIVVPWASVVVFSRAWLGYHTWNQVAVGSGFGVSFAALWFSLWTSGGLNVLGTQFEEWVMKLLES